MNPKKLPLMLVTAVLFTAVPQAGLAGAPVVATDEAVYINLDYYGQPTATSIVKGCNLNGNTDFTDFGQYEKVSNMSGHTQPELSEQGVHWSLSLIHI